MNLMFWGWIRCFWAHLLLDAPRGVLGVAVHFFDRDGLKVNHDMYFCKFNFGISVLECDASSPFTL